jgi:hypothetical protein
MHNELFDDSTVSCEFSKRVLSALDEKQVYPYSTFEAPNLSDPSTKHPVSVFLIDDPTQVAYICEILTHHSSPLNESMRVIGFDTETRAGRFKRPIHIGETRKEGCHSKVPSLLQLAVSEYIVFIFQTYVMTMRDGLIYHDCLRPLRELVDSNNILKVGVAASRDMQDLAHFFGFSQNNILDLDVSARSLGLPKHSLAALTYMYCHQHLLSKWNMLIFSDFDKKRNDLDLLSVNYAARDALYSLKVYKQMTRSDPVVPRIFPDFTKVVPEEYR